MTASTLTQAFSATVASRPERVAFRTLDSGVSLTWAQVRDSAETLARGLHELGLQRGQSVALLLSNRPEFNTCDLAAMLLGAVPFSIYTTYAPEQIEFVVADSGAEILITEQVLLSNVLIARKNLPRLRHVVVIDGADPGECLSLVDVQHAGRASSFDVAAASAAVAPDNLLTLIYTSGTVGDPKGVELTHRNMMAAVEASKGRVTFPDGARVISWLPAAHIAERAAHHYFPIVHGAEVVCCPDPRQIGSHLAAVQPTWFFSVPRVFEKLKAGLELMLAAAPDGSGPAAVALALEKVRLEQAGRPVPSELAAAVALADDRIFAALRTKVGFGELATVSVGAAPTPPEVLEFFHAIGVPVAEVWGLSETTACGTSNPGDRIRIGTAGTAAPGVELRIAEDGEVLVRGECVMRGYRNQPERTAEAVMDGWLHTGDIGSLDADGYLRIVDRKKELIINAMGKNMSPATIESRIKASSPLIGQACCIGDGRPYNTALIVLDVDAAGAWAADRGRNNVDLATLAADEELRAAVQLGIEDANARLSRPEQIKKFTVVDVDWLPAGDELTPTMKLRRRPIAAKYGQLIERMYAP